MKHLRLALPVILSSLWMSSSAFAGDNPETVIELFTSQGCSSCPPANEFVGDLMEDKDKLVLSYGVTYWDYLGWKDTFGNPEYTRRQKEYSASFGLGHVYTPQIVLNGADHNNRYTRKTLQESNPLTDRSVKVDVEEMDGFVYVTSNADRVFLVTYTPGWQKVAVKRGENGGRTLRIGNVVDKLEVLKTFGQTELKREPGKAYAALVHDPETHRIIAASVLD